MKVATREGTQRFAARTKAHPGAFSDAFDGLRCSSLGLGTYLGAATDVVDDLYEAAILRALDGGINVFDTAINYRCQRSERALGKALAKAFADGRAERDEVVIASKIGFIPYDGEPPSNAAAYIREAFVRPGIFQPGEIVSGHHVLSANFVRFGIDRSLENLGLDALDIYFLHNPETQLETVPRPTFLQRLRDAIEAMEEACALGKAKAWGIATWDGLRLPPSSPEHLSLEEVMRIAREISGDNHRFGAIELPYNLSMPQALTRKTQSLDGEELTALQAARRLNLGVFTSATLHEARLLSRKLPAAFAHKLPGTTHQASRAIQFVRSTPGVTTALVGMKQVRNVEANAEVMSLPKLSGEELEAAMRALRGG